MSRHTSVHVRGFEEPGHVVPRVERLDTTPVPDVPDWGGVGFPGGLTVDDIISVGHTETV
jgi:hypothetical protein